MPWVPGFTRRATASGERERLIGVITVGPCGAIDTEGTVLATQDGKGTHAGGPAFGVCGWYYGKPLELCTESRRGKTVFLLPARFLLQVGQQYDSFDFGTPLDTVDTVDAECLSGIVDTLLVRRYHRVVSLDNPVHGPKPISRITGKNSPIRQDTANRIPFGTSPESFRQFWCSGKVCGSDPQYSKPAGGALSVPHEVVWPERAISGQLLFYK